MKPLVFAIWIIALNHFICCFAITKAILRLFLHHGFHVLVIITILVFGPGMIRVCHWILILQQQSFPLSTFFGFFEWRFGNTFSTTWWEATSSFCRIYTLRRSLSSNHFSFLIETLPHCLFSHRSGYKMTTDYSDYLESLCHHHS